ncbi:Bifunctional protein PutA [Corynebacterium ciconiae DSM 44920]|uniref:bifunctional proline dehydrogenase/L-glutamate gamma-semialdehyde dehydrogenase n=1 Tax=Corynebacterium ciconiae TaxID=227319 RepID=UPI00035F1AD2|nr:bifunctional proline dehydrogenase/L-glutamate gamma-semialdehyde dehydrogenase [Corynebacterium ciconiae]WKD61288.1 Bifunctional protein PutA [Corynebacterium ciconiae DSM 44920]
MPIRLNDDLDQITDRAIARAQRWMRETETASVSKREAKNTALLSEMVRSEGGIDFTMGFVDRVARPEDNAVSARELNRLASPLDSQRRAKTAIPDFMGVVNKSLITAGSLLAPAMPQVAMPIARTKLRQMVGHLVFDAQGSKLDKLLDRAAEQGFQLNVNLLGEAVLGEKEADRRLERTLELLENPKVTYVSIKASAVVSQLNHWDFDGSVAALKEKIRPLYRAAKARADRPFINLDMEEYNDLELTLRLFTELMDEEEFQDLETGIVIQAYLPDSVGALEELVTFARARVAHGGAPIKVRIVKGANLSMERVEAEMHDWPQAPYMSKAEVDANYLRLLDYVLDEDNADAIRIGVASHNLYTLATAIELAEKRGVTRQLDIEMLQGMAPAQSRVVQRDAGRIILYTPVVHKEDFDVAISYLVRRLEENGEPQNFIYAMFAPDVEGPDNRTPLEEQQQRYLDAVRQRWEVRDSARRTQNRTEETGTYHPGGPGQFYNEPDTDPALPTNREWALNALAQDPGAPVSAEITDPAEIDKAVATAKQAHRGWAALSGAERAEVLDRAADALARYRGRLISVAAHEAGKTVDQTDPEVSEAIDFAHYYAESARAIDAHSGAKFSPYPVVVVTPPWNFPIAIPMGGVFAALAAGSAVIIKPAPQVLRCAEVAVEALREAGIGEDILQLVNADEGEAGKRLISHEDVDSVILTGASDTAKLFRSWKPEMVINAETSGKNALIITPAADPDLAVSDLYHSAFGHAGQKCSAASLAILVGSAGESERIIGQLVDAVSTLKVGVGTDISTTMNGIIEAPGEKLLRGLTTLEPGERWLIKPRKLNEEGTLWSPGIRDNVQPGSWYHTHECFGPVLGIMRARNLDEAIEWQNSTGYGLTGGLHSLDEDEIQQWVERVEVGNAYVNRGITGAIVQRQSFGGWKKSALGSGAKAGGPNYVAQQGVWSETAAVDVPPVSLNPTINRALRDMRERAHDKRLDLSAEDLEWLQRAACSDQYWWEQEFGRSHDRAGLQSEANIFRYRPLLEPLQVHLGEGWALRDLLRIHLGALRTGTTVVVTGDAAAVAEARAAGLQAEETERVAHLRVRVLGDASMALRQQVVSAGASLLEAPVLSDGRRELLPLLLEQAVSVTTHRFGHLIPNPLG